LMEKCCFSFLVFGFISCKIKESKRCPKTYKKNIT